MSGLVRRSALIVPSSRRIISARSRTVYWSPPGSVARVSSTAATTSSVASLGFPNQPIGADVLFDDALTNPSYVNTIGGGHKSGLVISDAVSAGQHSAPSSIRAVWKIGDVGFNPPQDGYGFGGIDKTFTLPALYRVTYLGFYINPAANMTWHPGGTKLLFIGLNDDPDSDPRSLVIYVAGSGNGNKVNLDIQWPPQGFSGAFYAASAGYTLNAWNLLEVIITANSAGTAAGAQDGRIQVFKEGVQVIDATGLDLSNNTNAGKVDKIWLAPYWGGGSVEGGITVDTYIDYDHVRIAGLN